MKPKKHSSKTTRSTDGKAAASEGVTSRVSLRRLWWFRFCAAVLVPLAMIGGLEVGLRLFGYGYPTSFFLQTRIKGRDYYVTNDRFGYRFFPRALARTPAPQRMAVDKAPHTYRIFVFGESAAMGDPDPSFGFWRYLQVLLRERFPGTDFQVICTAMTAIDSDVILPIARECARRNGDLWIIYMGNNEMVGPFGGGTVFDSRAPGTAFIRADIAVKATRVGQLMNGLIQRWVFHAAVPATWGGLSMFEHHQLRYDDPNRLQAYANFKKNLEDILRAGRNAGVPIILSTVGSNLKDCAPFASLHAAGLTKTQRARWDGIYQAGIALESAGEFRGALKKYARANGLDPQYAELHFRAGRCQLAVTNYSQALRELVLARDDDALAFRADTRINQIIKHATDTYAGKGVYFLDANRILAQDSPGNIPGNELFYEHVHLNFAGNYCLARAFAAETAKLLPKSIVAHDKGKWASAEFCNHRLAVSTWDRYRIWQEILARISVPPYTGQLTHDASVQLCEKMLGELKSRMDSEPAEQTLHLYRRAITLAPTDSFLHQNFAQYLGAKGDLVQATTEAQRVCELLPQMPAEYNDIGRLLVLQGKIDAAAQNFSHALAIRGDYAPALNGLGQILANRQKFKEAAACFEHALRVNADDVETCINLGFLEQNRGNYRRAADYYQDAARLQPQGPADYLNQGVTSAALGQSASAVESFGVAVQLKPDFWQAHYLFGVELASEGNIVEARRQFSETVLYRPDFAKAHMKLGVILAKQGELEQALTQFQITLQLDPTDPTAQRYLKTIDVSKGRKLEGNSD